MVSPRDYMTLDFWAPPTKNSSIKPGGKKILRGRSTFRIRAAVFMAGFAFVYLITQAVVYVGDFELPVRSRSSTGRKPLFESSIVAVVNDSSDCNSAFDTTAGPVFYFIATLYTFLGLAIVCDEYFVESLDAISNFLHLSEDVAGATFMAAGSSAPELFTAIITILITPGEEGLGTIVGSAVFNIMVIVGVTAIFAGQTLDIWWYPLLRDSFVYAVSIVELVVFISVTTEGEIDWWEALILILTYGGYLIIMVLNGKIVKFLGEVELNRQRRIKLAKKQKEKEKEEKEREEREKKLIEEELLKADQKKKDEEKDKEDDPSANAAALGLTKWGAFRNRKVAPEQRVEEAEFEASKKEKEEQNNEENNDENNAENTDVPAGEEGEKKEGEGEGEGEGESSENKAEGENKEDENVGQFDSEGFEIKKPEGDEGENKEEAEENADANGEEGEKSDEVLADEEEERQKQDEALAKINNIFAKAAQARKEKKATDAPANPMLALLRAAAADEDGTGAAGGAPGKERTQSEKEKDENPFADRIGVNPLLRKEFKATFDKNAKTERSKMREDLQMKFTTAIVVESVATKWLEKIGKRRSTQEEILKRKQEEEAKLKEEEEEEQEGIMSKIQGWAITIISYPYILAMKFTIPDCRKDMFKKWFMATFIMSIAWIGLLSYFMVEFASRLGCIFSIPEIVMGLTIIAAGTSVPDALSSIVVAQNGQGDMAVANVLGSNVFNILLGLGVPWLIAVIIELGDPFAVAADNVTEPIIILFIYLALFIGIIALAKWRLFPTMGYILILLDVVFIIWSVTTNLCECAPWRNYD